MVCLWHLNTIFQSSSRVQHSSAVLGKPRPTFTNYLQDSYELLMFIKIGHLGHAEFFFFIFCLYPLFCFSTLVLNAILHLLLIIWFRMKVISVYKSDLFHWIRSDGSQSIVFIWVIMMLHLNFYWNFMCYI